MPLRVVVLDRVGREELFLRLGGITGQVGRPPQYRTRVLDLYEVAGFSSVCQCRAGCLNGGLGPTTMARTLRQVLQPHAQIASAGGVWVLPIVADSGVKVLLGGVHISGEHGEQAARTEVVAQAPCVKMGRAVLPTGECRHERGSGTLTQPGRWQGQPH
jgi:hypothetical protein